MNNTASNPVQCQKCGAPLTGEAVGGLCPRCLMAMNLATQTEVAGETGPHGTKVVAPAGIAALFPQLEILECLGRGGMGVVYRARQPKLNRLVALKLLAPEKGADAKFAERFTREAQALARLNHPNIVTVYDFGEAGGHCYLLMEFVDGVSLRQMLESRKLQPEEALAIVPRICDALQYAHEQGIVHRDIKPENILLDKQGRVKIADFGIAKLVGAGQPQAPLTEEQSVIGTPHYMAPEQIEHPLQVDHRADIYSLGVVFYEMLTGELPLGKFAPPSRKVQVDVRLDEVVLHTLEKEPERRYQQASQVKTAVETIASTASSAPVGSVRPSSTGIPAHAKTSGLAIASLVLGILGALTLGVTALAGLILGLMARRRITKSQGQLSGSGLAIAGVVVSAVFLFFGMALSGTMLLPVLARAKGRARSTVCAHNLRQLALAVATYADANGDRLPPASTWCDALLPLAGPAAFQCPLRAGQRCGYAFNQALSGKKLGEVNPRMVLLFESDTGWNGTGDARQLAPHGHPSQAVNVAFADFSVQQVKLSEVTSLQWNPSTGGRASEVKPQEAPQGGSSLAPRQLSQSDAQTATAIVATIGTAFESAYAAIEKRDAATALQLVDEALAQETPLMAVVRGSSLETMCQAGGSRARLIREALVNTNFQQAATLTKSLQTLGSSLLDALRAAAQDGSGLAAASGATDRAATASVAGWVTDESGKPLNGVWCRVSAIEEFRDGRWELTHYSGLPLASQTDADGRFALAVGGQRRYDLQLDKWGYAPAFFYQIASGTTDLRVELKPGVPVRGTIVRSDTKEPISTGAMSVELRLPSRDFWFKQTTLVGPGGRFQLYAGPAPTEPGLTKPARWQVVFAGKVMPIDVVEGKPVDVRFEVDVNAETSGVTNQSRNLPSAR